VKSDRGAERTPRLVLVVLVVRVVLVVLVVLVTGGAGDTPGGW
jgi:hypothetical protein